MTDEEVISLAKGSSAPVPEKKPPVPTTYSDEQVISMGRQGMKSTGDPVVPVGARTFSAASSVGQVGVDFFAGSIKHGTELLNKMGLAGPETLAAASQFHEDFKNNYKEFVDDSMKYYGGKKSDYPYTNAAADVAGNILLYSMTGPAFMTTGMGKAIVSKGGIIGKMIAGATQGASLEAIKSDDDPGKAAFAGALGGAFGTGAGEVMNAGVSRVVNAGAIGKVARWAKVAAEGWNKDSQMLAKGIQARAGVATENRQLLVEKAQEELRKAGLPDDLSEPLKKNAPAYVRRAVEKANKYLEDTEYLTSKIFATAKQAGDAADSGPSWKQANDKLLKIAGGDDRVNAEKLWKALLPRERELTQKGILYSALDKATVTGSTKYDPVKFKEALDTSGVKQFFNSPADQKLLSGFQTIVGESSNFLGHHPYLVAHGVSGLAGGALGYHRGGVEGAAEGLLAYTVLIKAVSMGLSSQAGRNLIAAAGRTEPGTPLAGRIFRRLTELTEVPLGTEAATAHPQRADAP